MPTTSNFGIPLYGPTDTAELDVLMNGQSNALDTALLGVEGRTVGTDAQRLALAAPRRKNGLVWYSSDTNAEWRWNGTTWIRLDSTVIGVSKGTTTVPTGTWQALNTATATGTNIRNDGYTYGTGDIDVPYANSLYNVSIGVTFPSGASGFTRAIKFVGASGYEPTQSFRASVGSGNVYLALHAILPVTTAIVVQAFQDSGGNLSVVLESIAARYIGPT